MEQNRMPGRLKDIRSYILRALKFFDLKNESLTPVIFCIILFTSLLISVPGAWLSAGLGELNMGHTQMGIML